MADVLKGKILSYDSEEGSGVIRDALGAEHRFSAENWEWDGLPEVGTEIQFLPGDTGHVRQLFLMAAEADKSRRLAGVLAIVFGVLGLHKFYLGYPIAGVIMLVVSFLGWITIAGPIVTALVGIVEGAIYLTRSDEDFADRYVIGRRAWF